MEWNTIITLILAVAGSGGSVAVINSIFNKNKNKAEAAELNVKTAIELEKMAMTRYNDLSKTLEVIEKALVEAKRELNNIKEYNAALKNVLKAHEIEAPDFIEREG